MDIMGVSALSRTKALNERLEALENKVDRLNRLNIDSFNQCVISLEALVEQNQLLRNEIRELYARIDELEGYEI